MTQSDSMTTKFTNQRSIFAFSTGRPIQVALVGDQSEGSENWVQSINAFPNFNCVCCCASAEQALLIIPKKLPDVVLMDISLPRMSGIECTARLKAQLPDVQVIMFTARTDDEFLFLSLEAGADGYLLKPAASAGLRDAILEVLRGGVPMSQQISRRLVESFRNKGNNNNEAPPLSIREEHILRLVSKGYSNRLIAEKLDIGIETVSTHMKRVFKKLRVSSRTEAAMRYIDSKFSPRDWNNVKASRHDAGLTLPGRLDTDVFGESSLAAMSAYSMV